MDHGPDLELSLLEGMDEDLLRRFYEANLRTRSELGQRLATPESRQELAHELRISPRRLHVLHYLNFLMPEERAEMQLDLERRVRDHAEDSHRDIREVRRLAVITLAILIGVTLVLSGLVFISNHQAARDQSAVQEKRLRELEQTVSSLAPLGRARAEEQILGELNVLGPAPGWNAPRPWTQKTDEEMTRLLGKTPDATPARAVSLLLFRLTDLEQARWDSLPPLGRAQAAAQLLTEFPPPTEVHSVWDAAAVVLRTRLRGRAAGLAPADKVTPPLSAADTWGWTSGDFLTCEELLARLEALPLRPSSMTQWSETLMQIRQAADQGRDKRVGLPEQNARDYWLRRAELEYGVVAVLLGRTDLFPYHSSAPRAFLQDREQYVTAVLDRAPVTAKPALAWLALECEEAVELADWLVTRGTAATAGGKKNWIEALDAVEKERAAAGLTPGPTLSVALARASSASGEGGDPWTASRTRYEAGLRPLLMVTRAGARARLAPSHASP
ncbi:MAG TPA: hypothetical protein VE910_04905 [Dongiaceae bacterium]|jgi:hypothetical protein|nr:hypothetical protein [Dongiaceae bacterium]